MAINPPAGWGPKHTRMELRRLRVLIDANKCPYDSKTLSETINALEERHAIIRSNARPLNGWIPDFGKDLLIPAIVILGSTLTGALTQTPSNSRGFTVALVIELAFFVISFAVLRVHNFRLERRASESESADEYRQVIDMLRRRIDDSREYTRLDSGVYAAVLGADDDMRELHEIRRNIMDLGSYPLADKIMLIEAVDARLSEFIGRPQSDRFKSLLRIVKRGLNTYRPEPTPSESDERRRVDVETAADPEDAPRAADPKQKEEGA